MEELLAMVVGWGIPMLAITAFMLFDVVTGFAGAYKKGEVASGKMREGLWHKAGFYGLAILAALYEIVAAFTNFEADMIDLGMTLPQAPLVGMVCAYVIGTELVSICENLIVFNPDIAKAPFLRNLIEHDPGAADMTVEIEDAETVSAGGSE